ncbi:hypothetical protein ASE00_07505 [Sphingomonas sp. Root710]|nr:hypothetical protein ASE00_07505 [Sphingomonas sp. Root710]
MVRQVQIALKTFGYEPGAITGTLTAETKVALMQFQKDCRIAPTGRITPDTLDALRISAQ